MSDRRLRVLVVSSHPVQYAAPLYRLYAEDPRIELTVAYCSLEGAEEHEDEGFGVSFAWDVPLLEGYHWVHVPNRSPRPALEGLFGLVNPGLWTLIRKARPDVVMCWGYRSVSHWVAYAAAKSIGSAWLFGSEAHNWMSRRAAGWKPAVKRILIPRLYGLADGVIALSSATVRFLRGIGIPADRIFLTPFAVDNAFFAKGAADADREAFRARHGIPSDAIVALLCGKMVPYKRPLDLIEAAARVPGLHVAFVGDGILRPAIETRISQLGVTDRVHLLGFINQQGLPEAYASADILAVPSEFENFPLVVPEAFASGLPAIATETCSAVGDLVVDGETGYVIRVGDVDRLAQRLEEFASNPELRATMRENVHGRIGNWSPELNAQAFVQACVETVSRRRQM
jgi:glycosyltransferase involved in cell wall biosynthesis